MQRRWQLNGWLTCLLVSAVALWAGATACGPSCDKDSDAEMMAAPGLLAGGQVTDSIGADEGCDKTDWRHFVHFEDARVTITYRVGDPGGHELKGIIELYDASGAKLAAKDVNPGMRDYVFEFEAEANKKYFIVIQRKEGSARYLIEASAEALDPCAECTEDEICEDGRCLPKPEEELECEPECRRGYECVDGECKKVRCARGEYYHGRSRECRPDPCYRHRCPSGQRCRRSRGAATCVDKRPRTPPPGPAAEKKCPASCPAGQSCDPATKKCRPTAPISGRILNCWPEGGKFICLVNKGSQQGVKRGTTGRGGGRTYKVIAVYPYQCRVSTPKTDGPPPSGAVSFKP